MVCFAVMYKNCGLSAHQGVDACALCRHPRLLPQVELVLDGVTKKVTIPEGTSVLEAAEIAFDDPPFSCRNGVCTSCECAVHCKRDGGRTQWVAMRNVAVQHTYS
jgi:2Fe-2S iron-sulfur cluster binding domain